MTIFDDDGNEKEKVQLHTITEKPLLHQLMKEKGFVRMSPEETAAKNEQQGQEGSSLLSLGWSKLDQYALSGRKDRREAVRKRRMDEKEYLGESGPSYISMFGLYGVALVSLGALGQVARRRRQSRKLGR